MIDFSTALNIYKAATTKKRTLKVKPETSILTVCMMMIEVGIEDYTIRPESDGTNVYLNCTESQWLVLGKLLDAVKEGKMNEQMESLSKFFKED